VGVRHALFPRLLTFGAQLHPSSAAGCQFPDAALVCMDDCRPFRPRSGAGLRCHHRGLSGETSQPGLHAPAGALPPDPVRMPLRTAASAPLPQGRHRTCPVAIVGLAPRVLPLTPRVAFSFSAGRPPVGDLPQFGSYCVSAVTPASRHFPSDRALRDDPVPFPGPVATPDRCGG
jgi:hypothetical protein